MNQENVAALVEFVTTAIVEQCWDPCGGMDGGDLQDLAERLNLIEPCGENCAIYPNCECPERGVGFTFTKWLARASADAQEIGKHDEESE